MIKLLLRFVEYAFVFRAKLSSQYALVRSLTLTALKEYSNRA